MRQARRVEVASGGKLFQSKLADGRQKSKTRPGVQASIHQAVVYQALKKIQNRGRSGAQGDASAHVLDGLKLEFAGEHRDDSQQGPLRLGQLLITPLDGSS